MFIDKALGTSCLKMGTFLGYRQYAHCIATGKAILAYQSDQVINQYIRKVTFVQSTPTSINDAQELLKVLD
nr:IclR family transcriptional regulator C-terminal domain-containing protein [Anaerotignum sp.]